NGSRTRDLQLGKLTLYQLSYFRLSLSPACVKTSAGKYFRLSYDNKHFIILISTQIYYFNSKTSAPCSKIISTGILAFSKRFKSFCNGGPILPFSFTNFATPA